MLQQIQDKSVHLLETIVERLEEFDQLKKRPRVFGQASDENSKSGASDGSPRGTSGEALEELAPKDKLKQLSFELIDIGLHSSKLAVDLLQSTEVYQGLQERFNNLDEKVRDNSVELYKFFNDRVYTPVKSNLYVIYDRSTQVLSFLMQVVNEHQQKMRDYLAKHYENVHVLFRDNWMRLDFNTDGQVSIEDIKTGAQELFEFLKSFDYLQAATDIKSSLYQEAIKYMKKDLSTDKKSPGRASQSHNSD